MKNKSLFYPLLFLSLVFSLIIFFIISFIKPIPENIFHSFKTAYQIRNFIILYIEYFFPVYIASAIFSYSCSIKKDYNNSGKSKNFFFNLFKSTLLLSLIVFALFFLMQEMFLPGLYSSQEKSIAQSLNHDSLIILAKQNIAEKNYSKADMYLTKALELDSKNPELLDLKQLCYVNNKENLKATGNFSLSEAIPEKPAEIQSLIPLTKDENITVEQAIETAEFELKNKNWFNAHYYATLASQLAGNRNADKDKALRIASISWNMIDKLTTSETQQNTFNLFNAKYEGYMLFQQKAYIDSYYHFLDLNAKFPKDPDISFFLNLSKEKVQQYCFFIDEFAGYEFFESHNNKLLKIPCSGSDNEYCIIYFRGLSQVNKKNLNTLYFRDFSFYKFENDKFIYSAFTPYAKMVLEVNPETNTKYPVILVNSLDKKNKNIQFKASFSGNKNSNIESIILPEFSIQDFYKSLNASYGIETLNIPQLLELISQSDNFALSKELIISNLIFKISYPLLFLVFCMFAPILGLKFSRPLYRKFQFYWILFIPLIFIMISLLILNFELFLMHLIFYIATHAPLYFSLTIPVFLIIIFIVFSIILSTQRIENNEFI